MQTIRSASALKQSQASYFLSLPLPTRQQRLASLTPDELEQLRYLWSFWARPEQQIPGGDWQTWLILAGRGFGKTRTGAETVRQWIKNGAVMPKATTSVKPRRGAIDMEQARQFWSFQPPQKNSLPQVASSDWPQTLIDNFVLSKLEANGLSPATPAAKRTLIRRVTFDLTGLPPTPDDIVAFLSDDSPAAFSRVVDRLLNSHAYGERWGRHWLDVARYADSNGLDENVAHGNAWRYRDCVVAALNEDKPFDQFVTEQLAGDLLEHDSEQDRIDHLVATGFLSLGPKVLAEGEPGAGHAANQRESRPGRALQLMWR